MWGSRLLYNRSWKLPRAGRHPDFEIPQDAWELALQSYLAHPLDCHGRPWAVRYHYHFCGQAPVYRGACPCCRFLAGESRGCSICRDARALIAMSRATRRCCHGRMSVRNDERDHPWVPSSHVARRGKCGGGKSQGEQKRPPQPLQQYHGSGAAHLPQTPQQSPEPSQQDHDKAESHQPPPRDLVSWAADVWESTVGGHDKMQVEQDAVRACGKADDGGPVPEEEEEEFAGASSACGKADDGGPVPEDEEEEYRCDYCNGPLATPSCTCACRTHRRESFQRHLRRRR